ncbi:MAG: ATP-dependent DNA helicase RecG [Coriobacteriales bacterium]|jgi:ATP-dependent DNA helicase RecG|nr:ATP-dependent DNA helicase RecG [Coriobacteriales bacterium]
MSSRIEQTATLEYPITELRFVYGPRFQALRCLGITDIRGLINHYPFRYNDFTNLTSIAEATVGQQVSILGRIDRLTERKTAKGGMLLEAFVFDGSGVIKAVWFNQSWLSDQFSVGDRLLLLGKLEHYNGFKTLSGPLYALVEDEAQGDPARSRVAGSAPASASGPKEVTDGADNATARPVSLAIDPSNTSVREPRAVLPCGLAGVYHSSGNLTSNWIRRLQIEVQRRVPMPLDPLPVDLRLKHQLISRQSAWRQIHFPQNRRALTEARRRLIYEEVFWLQLSLAWRRLAQQQTDEVFVHTVSGQRLARLKAALPFELTVSQHRAASEILADMAAGRKMDRMLLGDVGSGKTIVAGLALAAVADSGWQAAMMAPTEVLAQQFATGLGPLLDSAQISWALLTSSTPVRERKRLLAKLANGSLSILFGTHALLEDDVSFQRLSLAVIDEQQRFGVRHREQLLEKSVGCDFLSMTATPIPRSLALVVYGDVQTSYLDSRPMPARIRTQILRTSEKPLAYTALKEALTAGQQAYIVCPTISPPGEGSGKSASPRASSTRVRRPAASAAKTNWANEDVGEPLIDNLFDFDDGQHVAAAEEELEYLQTRVFPDRHLALLTSRLPAEQKKQVMENFRAGAIDILVSTTVIEVGVDVPNATVMLIEDADRFGLAQLHQLRGRVGRGQVDAQVFMISQTRSSQARERLALLEHTTDGLKLAEADLRLRREGDIIGIRQHGKGLLRLTNVVRDAHVIVAAQADVRELLAADPMLSASEHQHMRYELNVIYPPDDEDPPSIGDRQCA